MIDFHGITIQRAGRTILKDFSATILSGQFIGILGENGAGKSTLLHAILGLIPLTHGHIAITDQPPHAQHKIRIGYLPQSRQLFLNNRLQGRARLSACIQGSRWGWPFLSKKDQHQLDQVLEMVGAKNYALRPFNELSGGEKQRLLLAQALLNQPQILLLDEPLTSLDIKQQYQFIDVLRDIQHQGVTILLTTHDVNPLLSITQKIIYLAKQKAIIGAVGEVINSECLSKLYAAPIEVVRYGQKLFVYHSDSGMLATHFPFGHKNDQ